MSSEIKTTDHDLEQLTAIFRLLSDKTRLNILLLLAGGERNVTNLCDALQLPQPTVSHHLGLLRMNSVIVNRRSGKQVYYALNEQVGINQSDAAVKISVDAYTIQITPNQDSPAGE